MYYQIFSCGLSSGLFDGIGMMEMLSAILSLGVRCQPAWSMSTAAYASAATAQEISCCATIRIGIVLPH